jgi:hypothetical protein
MEVSMCDFSARLIFSPCMHRHVTVETLGGRSFSEGEVFDNIQERLRCLDCLEYLTEAEVRAAWGQESAEDLLELQLGGIHGDGHCDSQ